jgi:Protein of unknown function (DUF2911)
MARQFPNRLFLHLYFFSMKRFFLLVYTIVFLLPAAFSQSPLPEADKSPMDMCYYPVNYPLLKIQSKATEALVARVVYSRPKKEGRAIFGGLVEYGKLWRLGANEATEIEFYKPVIIGGKKIAKGRYTLYAIVNEKSWTLIINKETDVWGSFVYNKAKDLVRIEVPVQALTQPAELLSMTFEKSNGTINLIIAWENIKVALPINL